MFVIKINIVTKMVAVIVIILSLVWMQEFLKTGKMHFRDKIIDGEHVFFKTLKYDYILINDYVSNDKKAYLIRYKEENVPENLSIPSTIRGYKVEGLLNHSVFSAASFFGGGTKGIFQDNKEIKNVILPETINYIYGGAFYNSGIESITFNGNIKDITSDCFKSSNKLKKIIINKKVTELGELIFEGRYPIIYGEKGSYAEEYAKSIGRTFEPLQ